MAVEIALQNGRGVTVIDSADRGLVEQFKWWIKRGPRAIYATTRCARSGFSTSLHRHISGLLPNDPMMVDHINGDGLDNRRSNLRVCSRADNAHNSRFRRISCAGYRGVDMHGRRYRAKIMADRIYFTIGIFDDALTAAAVYDAAAILLHGEFATINGVTAPPTLADQLPALLSAAGLTKGKR